MESKKIRTNRRRVKRNKKKITKIAKKVNEIQNKISPWIRSENKVLGRDRYVNIYSSRLPYYGGFRAVNRLNAGSGWNSINARRFRTRSLAQYVNAILNPEIPIKEGFLVKQVSTMPIPSTGVSFKNIHTIKTTPAGNFYLSWCPNFMSNTSTMVHMHASFNLENLYASALANTFVRGDCLGGNQFNMGYLPSYCPTVDLSKYRLVSAKIKIIYTGAALQRSGRMYGCCTYDRLPVALVYNHDASNSSPRVLTNMLGQPLTFPHDNELVKDLNNAFNLWDENKIQNGMWPCTSDVSGSEQGIEALFLPSDPTDHTFYPMANFYSTEPDENYMKTEPFGGQFSFPQVLNSNDGAHLAYVFSGTGLPKGEECITIETYYNFEVIPTSESAPFMRITRLSRAQQRLNNLANKIAINNSQANGLIRKISDTITKVGPSILRAAYTAAKMAPLLFV